MVKIRSWKQEFDSSYRKLLNTYDVATIDAANEILLDAIARLNALYQSIKLGGEKNKKCG